MKFIWINLLAIVIALTSLVMEHPSVESFDEQLTAISQLPIWQTDSLRNQEIKHSEKTIHIAQDFIPIVVIADFQNAHNDFHHYLPIYSLVRQKEYFLLI